MPIPKKFKSEHDWLMWEVAEQLNGAAGVLRHMFREHFADRPPVGDCVNSIIYAAAGAAYHAVDKELKTRLSWLREPLTGIRRVA